MAAPQPSEPGDGPAPGFIVAGARERELVLEFVKGRSVLCPNCGYDLRDAPDPTCSECGAGLRLWIDATRPARRGPYLVAVLGVILGLVAGAMSVFAGAANQKVAPMIVGPAAGLACLVLVWLIENRFWRYWVRYADHRTAMVGVCWVPFAFAGLATLYALLP